MAEDNSAELERLRREIAVLQQRLGEREEVSQSGAGAIAVSDSVAAGQGGAAIGGNVTGPVIVAGTGANIVIGEQSITMV